MFLEQLDRAFADGDLHILHGPGPDGLGREQAGAVLDLIAAAMGRRARVIRVTIPADGTPGLPELAAQVPALQQQGGGEPGHRTLLVMDGASGVRPAMLRHLQQICHDSPHLRVVLAGLAGGAGGPDALLKDAACISFRNRPATRLHLDGHALTPEIALASALLSHLSPPAVQPSALAGLAAAKAVVPTQARPLASRPGLIRLGLRHRPHRGRRAGPGRLAMAAVGMAGLLGGGAWLLRHGHVPASKADGLDAPGAAGPAHSAAGTGTAQPGGPSAAPDMD